MFQPSTSTKTTAGDFAEAPKSLRATLEGSCQLSMVGFTAFCKARRTYRGGTRGTSPELFRGEKTYGMKQQKSKISH